MNRMGGGSRPGSEGQLKSIEGLGCCSGRCSGGQVEMGEDLGNHGRIFDGGDDRQDTAALRTLRDVDIEYPAGLRWSPLSKGSC